MMLFHVFGAFIATASFCLLWNIPHRFVLHASLIGAAGCWVYLLLTGIDYTTGTATFLAGCLVCLCCQILARVCRAPVTVFLIPGILPLVPGGGMYHIVYSMVYTAEHTTSYYITDTLAAAGMLALSIVILEGFSRLFPARPAR